MSKTNVAPHSILHQRCLHEGLTAILKYSRGILHPKSTQRPWHLCQCLQFEAPRALSFQADLKQTINQSCADWCLHQGAYALHTCDLA